MTSLYMLKNLPKMETYLEKLGQIHCTAGIPKRHLDIMGPLFCQAIRPILEVCMLSRLCWRNWPILICKEIQPYVYCLYFVVQNLRYIISQIGVLCSQFLSCFIQQGYLLHQFTLHRN